MRVRVASLTIVLPRSARDTVGCETPARCAMTSDVAFSLVRMTLSGGAAVKPIAIMVKAAARNTLPCTIFVAAQQHDPARCIPIHRHACRAQHYTREGSSCRTIGELMSLSYIDVTIVCIYAVAIFGLAQWV